MPFNFDVHATIPCANAPELERKIHKELYFKRVNRVKNRKEFFETTLEEIESILQKNGVKDFIIDYTHEAKDYRISLEMKKTEGIRSIS